MTAMRRERDYFGDEELILVYIAKRLKEALALEEVLDAASLDYVVEPEHYTGGVIFRSQRIGAFFYVRPPDEARARSIIVQSGSVPQGA